MKLCKKYKFVSSGFFTGNNSVLNKVLVQQENINPIQDGGKKAPSTSFSPVTSTNVGISPQNFLTFSFNPFSTLV